MVAQRSAELHPAELHSAELRLSWGECDPAGIVYYATYLHWAERVQSEWWYLAGVHLSDMAAEWGASFVTRHVNCEYLRSPSVMDLLRCSMSLDRLGNTSFTNRFRFTRADTGELQAELHLTGVFIDPERRPVAVPARARTLLSGRDDPNASQPRCPAQEVS